MKPLFLLLSCALLTLVNAQDKSDDVLIISVGESSDRYSDVATHLQGILSNSADYSDSTVDIHEKSSIESLADGYYDPNTADTTLRSKITEGYGKVILIPTIIQTPTGTIEYSEYNGGPTNVYDDAPLDNEYFTPEVFYEGCTKLSKLILEAGSTPMVFLPNNTDEAVATIGPVMYRVANGVGLELIPGSYAVASAGTITSDEQDYLYACSIFTKITGLNASVSTYTPTGLTSVEANVIANTAETSVNQEISTVHYTTSYQNDGAVVYRNLDVTTAPFNDVVRYMYKGSSTQDWTSNALDKIIGDNPATTVGSRKLGTRNGVYSTGVRYWHPDDITDQGFKFALEPEQAAFMYVSGSWVGADSQDVIDLTQSNMIPFTFDWIKSFAIGGESGTAATTDALDYHSCNELYFNYAERGWKLIPLTIGMGRLNEAVTGFSASDDGLHCSDPLVYMNAYMMLCSALGTEFPLPTNIVAADIHRGTYTTAEIQQACKIGHDIIIEHAHLSETGAYVPDSDLSITTDSLAEITTGVAFSYQLIASGGTGLYTWESISSQELPLGVTLSSDGILSGTLSSTFEKQNLAFQVTDSVGAFRKVGLKLFAEVPEARDILINAYPSMPQDITLPTYARDPSSLSYSYTNPINGTLTGTAPDLVYTPNAGATSDSFTYSFTHDGVTSETATVTIHIVELDCVYKDSFDNDGSTANTGIGGGWLTKSIGNRQASWSETGTSATYDNVGSQNNRAAILYSENTFQSDGGFQLTVNYTLSTSGAIAFNRFSFGLVSDDTDFTSYSINSGSPLGGNPSAYSLGAALTDVSGSGTKGLQFSDGSSSTLLDESGTNQDFIEDSSTPVIIRITPNHADGADWSYWINGVLEASGSIEEFDFSKDFHFTAYAQDNEYTKSIESVELCAIENIAETYQEWAIRHGLTGGDSLETTDADGDGISNIIEFALSGDPTESNSDILPVVTSSGNDVIFSFSRDTNSTDVTTQIFQYSSDLTSWTDIDLTNDSAAEVTITPGTDTTEKVEIQLTPLEHDERVFGRLKVSSK